MIYNDLIRITLCIAISEVNLIDILPRNTGSRYTHRDIVLCDNYTLYYVHYYSNRTIKYSSHYKSQED